MPLNRQHDSNFDFFPVRFITIDAHTETQRLDNFLMAQFRDLPKRRIYQMIRKGEVRINGGRAKATTRLKQGDEVRLPPIKIPKKEPLIIPSSAIKLIQEAIIYEDQHLLAINKPSGLAVHQGSGVDFGLIDILRAPNFSTQRQESNPYFELVHRLDRETSGLLLIAKSGQALRALQAETTQIRRFYQLLVQGNFLHIFSSDGKISPKESSKPWVTLNLSGSSIAYNVTAPLDTEHRIKEERTVKVSSTGKPAKTIFTPLKYFSAADLSLLEAELITGRTHQIRVHSHYCDTPILYDQRYGNSVKYAQKKPNTTHKKEESGMSQPHSRERLALHACRLEFTLFDTPYSLTAPLPTEFQHFIAKNSSPKRR